MEEADKVWQREYLAKALLQMKETEFVKLRFVDGSYRPYEYERWINAVTRTMTALHPEMGHYWKRVVSSAETVYNQYLSDVSVTRVSLKPVDILSRTPIEKRIEHKMRTVLMSAVLASVNHQCNFTEDLTCARILYRTMVLAGPASREDRKQMHDLLTQPKVIEISKLHDHLVMWKFASERLTKYGFQKPRASMLFDTLKMSCEKLTEKDGEFKFQLQSFIKEHSSVNGLVDMDTVKSLYDMILHHARLYLTVKAEANRATTEKPNTEGCLSEI